MNLPTWQEIHDKFLSGEDLSAIEEFIHAEEPTEKEGSDVWRRSLSSALDEGFDSLFNGLAKSINQTAHNKGWWDNDRNFGEIIALIHSELSEALEAARHGNMPSSHIPDFSGVEEEFADVIIRIIDYASEKKLRVAEALLAKIEYNRNRKHKHGGKLF